jgi:hypothetical protein
MGENREDIEDPWIKNNVRAAAIIVAAEGAASGSPGLRQVRAKLSAQRAVNLATLPCRKFSSIAPRSGPQSLVKAGFV